MNAISALMCVVRGHRPTRRLVDCMHSVEGQRAVDILLKMERKKYGPKAIVKRRYHVPLKDRGRSPSPRPLQDKYAHVPGYIESLFHHQCVQLDSIEMDIDLLWDT